MKKFSWKSLDDGRVAKELDFSSFEYNGTGVPKEFYSFFGVKDKFGNIKYENINIILKGRVVLEDRELGDKEAFRASLEWETNGRLRLFWRNSLQFQESLKNKFPEWESIKPHLRSNSMKMVFKKTPESKVFDIEFFDEESTENEKINLEAFIASNIKNPPKKKPKGSKKPIKKTQSSEQIVRDPEVHAWILNNSKWVCECCNKAAPFSKTNGYKYLEVHHVKRLADDGSDRITNAIAVCPNCHRELHYGKNRDNLVDSLYKRIKRLIRE